MSAPAPQGSRLDQNEVGEYASPACLMHEFCGDDALDAPTGSESSASGQPGRATRLVPGRALPRYAYLPGRSLPHPIRDPAGHSHALTDTGHTPADALSWGADLFNNGYYWEAHEAWEPLWQAASRGGAQRPILKALILLAAAGVKLREGKAAAAARHAGRAARLLESATGAALEPDTRLWLEILTEHTQALSRQSTEPCADQCHPRAVFRFALGLPTVTPPP